MHGQEGNKVANQLKIGGSYPILPGGPQGITKVLKGRRRQKLEVRVM